MDKLCVPEEFQFKQTNQRLNYRKLYSFFNALKQKMMSF